MPRRRGAKKTTRVYRTISNAIAISCCTSQDWIFTAGFYFFTQQIFAYSGQLCPVPDKIKFRFYFDGNERVPLYLLVRLHGISNIAYKKHKFAI